MCEPTLERPCEDGPAPCEDVGGRVVFSEPQRVPHRRDVEAAADPDILGDVSEMHSGHEDVWDALVPLRLEVVLGEPEGVESEPVEGLGDPFGLVEDGDEMLVREVAVVYGDAGIADVFHIDVTGVEAIELGNHGWTPFGLGTMVRRYARVSTWVIDFCHRLCFTPTHARISPPILGLPR